MSVSVLCNFNHAQKPIIIKMSTYLVDTTVYSKQNFKIAFLKLVAHIC